MGLRRGGKSQTSVRKGKVTLEIRKSQKQVVQGLSHVILRLTFAFYWMEKAL